MLERDGWPDYVWAFHSRRPSPSLQLRRRVRGGVDGPDPGVDLGAARPRAAQEPVTRISGRRSGRGGRRGRRGRARRPRQPRR
jgi:hypothetical protein